MIKPEKFQSSEKNKKGRVTRALRALVAGGMLAGATPAEALSQESYRDGARVEQVTDETRTVNVSREAGSQGEVVYRYVNNDAIVFGEDQVARMPIVPREEGIQNEDLYLNTLGLNPVVPRHLNLSPMERRAYALRSPEANADALIADGFPRELRSRLIQDFQRSQTLTRSQIEENQVYLVPGFVGDGMTQGGGNNGVRNVGLDAQEVRMRLERAQQGGARFVSYPAEVITTYIWTDARNVSYEITVFIIDECGNAMFKKREIQQIEQPVVAHLRSIPEAPTTPESNCIEVVVEGAPRSGESVGVIMMAEIRRTDQGALSPEEEQILRECLAETIRLGTVDPTNLCPDENCDYDRELREILTPVIRRAGIRGEVTITAISPMRSLVNDGTMRFFIPRPTDDATYLPAFCIFNQQGRRVYRSNLLIEENRMTIEENDPLLNIDMRANSGAVRWFQMNERNRTYREISGTPDTQR